MGRLCYRFFRVPVSGRIDTGMQNEMQRLMIYFLTVGPVMIGCLILICLGLVTLSLHGFSVDSSGSLYIGKGSQIDIYNHGSLTGSISPMTSRGYAFTIQPDDTILLSTGSTVYVLDIHGNVISKTEDVGTKTYNELQHKRVFIAGNGDKYVLSYHWGRTRIVCVTDKTIGTVYEMPAFEYIVKLLTVLSYGSLIIFVPSVIIKSRRIKKQ